MDNQPDLLFHYTSGNLFRRILSQGALQPDKTEPDNDKEVPTVTFSSNPVWENTRYRVGKMKDGKLVLMNKALLKQFDGGLIRIVVPKETAPLTWHEITDQCGISREAIQGIYNFAIEVGSRTSEWYGTTKPVPEDVWITVEILNDQDEWVELKGYSGTELEPESASKNIL